jgi:hypothetical protein
VVAPSFPFTRRFCEEEQVITSSCNHCFEVVATSDDDAELEEAERQHWCRQQAKSEAA